MPTSESTRKIMFSAISQWQSSGLTQLRFCKEQNIRYHVFHYWYKQFRLKDAASESNARPFIALKSFTSSESVFAELSVSNGKCLIFHQPVSADFLNALIK
jgi:hypothetical protein